MLRLSLPPAAPCAVLLVAACAAEPPCPPADLAPLTRPAAFTVVLTDYASTAIAVLDDEGTVMTEAWIDSGTYATGLRAGLGGDVVAVGSDPRGRIALLERFGYDVLTLVDPTPGVSDPVLQIDVRGDGEPPSGHSPNPQDVVFDGSSAWVTRYNPALDPSVPQLARGNDLVRVDLEAGRVIERVDLDADVQLDGDTIPARPSSIAWAGDVLVLALARVSGGFRVSARGAIVTYDPASGSRRDLEELEGLSNCGQLEPVPGEPGRVMVLCGGDAFAGADERRAEAAVLRLAIDDEGSIAIDAVWRAADHPDAPTPTSGLVPLERARAIAVADPRGDDLLGGHDSLVLIDLESGTSTTLLETDGPFALGQGAVAPSGSFLLIPDATLRALRRFELDAPIPRESEAIPVPTCRTLPPVQVSAL